MNITDQIVSLLGNLSSEERQLVLKLAEKDSVFLERLFAKIYRLKFAIQTGDMKLWKKIQEDEEMNSSEFIQELQDQEKIIQIHKKLESV